MAQPGFTTERLLLREISTNDAPSIFLLRSDEEHNRYVDRPRAKSMDDAHDFINKIEALVLGGQAFFWVIVDRTTAAFAGTICIWNLDTVQQLAHLGYELHPDFQGKGIMSEAMKPVLEFAFRTLQLQRLEAWPEPENAASVKLLQRNGFTYDEAATRNIPAGINEVVYVLTSPNYS